MKNIIKILLLICLSIGFILKSQLLYAQNNTTQYNMNNFNAKGVQASSENFTGTVWVNMNIKAEDNYNAIIGTVTFEPGARTNWHTHASGQILFVTSGVGYYQEKGKPVQIIKEGDVIKIPKNVEHWHGASHHNAMTHIAIVPDSGRDKTKWLSRVTDKEYDQALELVHQKTINLSENAIANRKELWPEDESKTDQTDPELIEIFDNWAFDEVIQKSDRINAQARVMMIMGSCIAQGALGEYKMFVNAALNIGVTPVEIKEILYQSIPYAGMAKVIDFIAAANRIFIQRDIALPLDRQSTTTSKNRFEKGLALQKEMFGERIDQMRDKAPNGQKYIQDFLAANCFGDYYTRTGLDIKTRELLTYSILISMGGTESQVRGHIQGNLNVGNDKERLIAITTQLLPYIGYPRTLNAIKAINEVAGGN
ncbi:carboxymuconolactone decarboxylase family protein [uncultured Bacteroides sp.]|uniref:(R)-mandelonitrile lyase n=1 Tax=uncultured Bacteroides sp. TaxID=162156 RepID=UPI002AA7D6ED|nr:carboxymuconolactone decarboxylase family protein [uncultured Bacteroides sp.]